MVIAKGAQTKIPAKKYFFIFPYAYKGTLSIFFM